MTAANGNLDMIYAGRLVAGLGIGASSLTVPVYISETAPPSIRGRLVGIFEIASQGGGMLGFWINYGTDQHISSNSVAQYVIPLALQLAPGLLLGLGMFFFCPESPRWLARQDNFEAAEKVLCNLRGLPSDHEYIMRELGDIRRQVEERSTLNRTKKEQFMKLFQRGTRNRMGIGLALMFLQSFTGVNIITYYGMSNLVPVFFLHLLTLYSSPNLRDPRHHRNIDQALLHGLLRNRQDTRHVHIHLLRCRKGRPQKRSPLGRCSRLHSVSHNGQTTTYPILQLLTQILACCISAAT